MKLIERTGAVTWSESNKLHRDGAPAAIHPQGMAFFCHDGNARELDLLPPRHNGRMPSVTRVLDRSEAALYLFARVIEAKMNRAIGFPVTGRT